jgi:hypothetical protein
MVASCREKVAGTVKTYSPYGSRHLFEPRHLFELRHLFERSESLLQAAFGVMVVTASLASPPAGRSWTPRQRRRVSRLDLNGFRRQQGRCRNDPVPARAERDPVPRRGARVSFQVIALSDTEKPTP